MSVASRILVCTEGHYSLRDPCPTCQGKTHAPHPPRYSPQDQYGEYRRRLKRLDAAKKA